MLDPTSFSIASNTPMYKEVRQKIMDSIRQEEWKPGDVIPSESKLCERFGVSMGTLRKAVDQLSAEGVLVRRQGRGTFVASHSQDRYLFTFFHIVRQDGHKEYPEVELMEFNKTNADAYTAGQLNIEKGSRLFRFVNRLRLGGTTVLIEEILLPEALFRGLNESSLRQRPGTLYRLYQEEFGRTVIRTLERIRAVNADGAKAGQLGVKAGDPLLHVIRVALSFRDQPVELRNSYVDTRRHEYYSEPMGASRS